MRTILFICTGNTCRSPMAEAIAQHLVDTGLLGAEDRSLAASAGVAAAEGMATSAETVEALASLEIAYEGRSKPLTAEMIRKADIAFVMTPSHAEAARALVGDDEEQRRKIELLDPDGPVEDPIGMGQAAYDELAQRFMELIPRRLQEVFSHEDRAGIGSPRS